MEFILIITMWFNGGEIISYKNFVNKESCIIAASIINVDMNKDSSLKRLAICI